MKPNRETPWSFSVALSSNHQYSLELIAHQVASSFVHQRASDGYVNATDLCSAAKKRWHQYVGQEATGNFLRALAKKQGVAVEDLAQADLTPGRPESVWVHPKVAIHLAQWLSADFAVLVSEWVYDWLSGSRGRGAELPYHIKRHMANAAKIPHTHFSILQEMTNYLIAPMELSGYTLPERLVPDISQGRMFCKWAREQLGLDTDSLPTYEHQYPDGRRVPAKLYPVEHLGAFRAFISNVWMPTRAEDYFRQRDPAALIALDKILKIAFQTTGGKAASTAMLNK
ncbi:KilA-N domain-containing protein [Ideonella sp. 3Y2]|uniref:KilA-N domain-containing protein n=2 Tax=Ideonella alba TaxID=2824118 RepID=A0A940Y796_9BURK|nr:KilA-N domain-containing protein [Ideonella alba]